MTLQCVCAAVWNTLGASNSCRPAPIIYLKTIDYYLLKIIKRDITILSTCHAILRTHGYIINIYRNDKYLTSLLICPLFHLYSMFIQWPGSCIATAWLWLTGSELAKQRLHIRTFIIVNSVGHHDTVDLLLTKNFGHFQWLLPADRLWVRFSVLASESISCMSNDAHSVYLAPLIVSQPLL